MVEPANLEVNHPTRSSNRQAARPPRCPWRPRPRSAGQTTLVLLLAAVLLASTGARASAPPPSFQQAPEAEEDALSPFVRQDDPPDDVRAVFDWGGGGGLWGTWCTLRVDGRLMASETVPCEVVLNTQLSFFGVGGRDEADALEALGWRRDQPVTYEITRPDGSHLAQTPDEAGNPSWSIVLGSPLGRYAVTARQGAHKLTGTFLVSARTQPSPSTWAVAPLVRVLPRYGPPGTRFRVALAGFDPRQVIRLHLYRGVYGGNPFYKTTLGSVEADDRGEATYDLVTRTEDPDGDFLVVTDPRSNGIDAAGPLAAVTSDPEARRLGPQPIQIEHLAGALVVEAKRTWASIVAKDGAPLSCLGSVFGGDWLARSQAAVEAMRARGQYRAARLLATPVVSNVTLVTGDARQPREIEVSVAERWDDRLFTADGSLVRVNPSRAELRYRLVRDEARGYEKLVDVCGLKSGWLIIESEFLREE